MNREEVEAKLREILTEDFRVPAEKITGDATFRGTFGMDSLDAVDLIYLVTKSFGMKQDIAAFRDLHTFALVVDYVVENAKADAK